MHFFTLGLHQAALGREQQAIEKPDKSGQRGQGRQDQGKVYFHACGFLAAGAAYLLSTWSTARKASCGISTRPTCFMRFLPSFCFSRSFFLRVASPP